MKFFKLEGAIVKSEWAMNISERRELIEKAISVSTKTMEFNEEKKEKLLLFISTILKNKAVLGIVLLTEDKIKKDVNDYLEMVDLSLENVNLEEVTYSIFRKMLSDAEHYNFIDCREDIMEGLGIDGLESRWIRELELGENLLEELPKEEVYEKAQKFLSEADMTMELDRIYQGHYGRRIKGHPVHYLIQTDDSDTRRETYRNLLSALYANERIQNKRYFFMNIGTCSTFFDCVFESIYKSSVGGAVVLRFNLRESEDEDLAGDNVFLMKNIMDCVKKYANDVLTIFCFPKECAERKEDLYKNFKDYSLIEIEEKFVYGKRAEQFLESLAKSHGLRANKKLLGKIEPEKGYLAPELRNIFDVWLNNRMKNECYSQYKKIKTIQGKLKEEKPKGSAYSELMEMIGLTEAKKVINQAIDYSKAQKLFADKGMASEVLSRHMVFTGNPGTAKTTVARLFARIMKENGILSRGQLVETGRADLVGKYVGWTAQIIKKKFEQAEGGVLFIDEAYSLVDDRNGSYGDEAINTIVQEMENHRKDTVVIFAGYPREMERFLAKNPGLSSRIAFHVPFEDYDTEELCRIASLIAKQKNLSLSEDACRKLETIFEIARKQKDFGNGRYVRNVIEHAKMAQASRLLAMDYSLVKKSDVETLQAEDFEMPKEVKVEKKAQMGFCA